jgi:hypothetical protein
MFTAATTAQYSRWWQRSNSPGLPAGQAVISNTINYSYQQYSQSTLSYAGADSSNRPVFFFAYANASNQLRAQLFRIENDGAITQGTEQSAGSVSVYRTVAAMSESEGANGFGGGGNPYIYLCYINAALTTAYGLVVNTAVDTLSCSFGTPIALAGTPDADQPVAATVATGSAVFGARTGTGMSVRRYTQSYPTLTAVGTLSPDQGFRIDAAELGFAPSGTTQYRSAYFDTGNGASGTVYGATELGATNYNANNTAITTSSQNYGCNLNSTDKMLGTYAVSGTVSAIAVPITWNLLSAPTFSPGSAVTAVTPTASGGAWFPVSGFATDTAYILYNDTASTISYVPITVSTSTVTVGSSVQMLTGLSNFYYGISGSSAKVGTKTYLAGVQIRSSGAPYIFGYRLS